MHVRIGLCISNEEKIHCEWDATSFVPPVTHRSFPLDMHHMLLNLLIVISRIKEYRKLWTKGTDIASNSTTNLKP